MSRNKVDIFQGQKVHELEEEWQNGPISKEEGRACQHRLERRWYRRLIELNILLIVGVIAFFCYKLNDNIDLAKQAYQQVTEEISQDIAEIQAEVESIEDESAEEKSSDEKKKDEDEQDVDTLTEADIPMEVTLLFSGIAAYIMLLLSIYYYHAYYCANSVHITENNFPEVYEMIEDYSRRLGIKTPKAYVVQQNGVLNAFSTFLLRKQWICIHSEIFEVAYREHKDMDALAFVIAHELAHIYYGHATFRYNLRILFSENIPIIGAIASRTREYSCDRLAQRLTGTDGLDAMLMLVMDRHLYKMVDKEDYIRTMREQRGFFQWVVNMAMDHPIMSKRVLALVDGRGSGKLY